jgi:hypothetical protein
MWKYDLDCAPAGETNMTQEAFNSVQIAHNIQSATNATATLLAQIPDLSVDDPESLVEERTATSDGRLIGQALASKLVLSGGILLVVAAILPFTTTKKTNAKPGDKGLSQSHFILTSPSQSPLAPPSSGADVAPSWNPDGNPAVAGRNPSGWPTAAGGVQPSVVVAAVAQRPGVNVAAPPWVDNVPGSVAAKSAPPVAGNNMALPNLPTQMPRANMPTEFPAGSDRTAQATTGMNRPMAIDQAGVGVQGAGAGVQGSGQTIYQADARNDARNTSPGDYPPGASAGVNPVMPDLNRELSPGGDAAAQRPLPEQQSPPPSAAQLEGNIIPIPPDQDHP